MSFSVPSAMLMLQIIGGHINSHTQEAERKVHFFKLSTNLGFPRAPCRASRTPSSSIVMIMDSVLLAPRSPGHPKRLNGL